MNNPLQTIPHLFVNGKFKAKWNGRVFNIISYDCDDNSFRLFHSGLGAHWVGVGACTLIARPIYDMSDNECHRLIRLEKFDASADMVREYGAEIPGPGLSVDGFSYLLSIGCYPFDQKHFEDGTVININKIE